MWVVEKLFLLPKGIKLLDAGAGECYYKKYCSHLSYVSQDFGKYDGKGDGRGIQTKTRDSSKIDIVSDIIDIPVKSGSFDAALCVEVFEHIPRPLDALKELGRILKKGGTLILTAPRTSLTHYSPFYYYSGFSESFYKDLLPDAGFEIREMYIYGNYFDSLSLELARIPLICYRAKNLLAITLLVFYPLVLPIYALLRVLSFLVPSSRDFLSFGICVLAKKI